MDNQTLVNDQTVAGTELLARLKSAGIAVTVAFWAFATEDERWYLYIASPMVDAEGLAVAYRKVNIELGRLQNPWIQRNELRLISNIDPIAQEALEYADGHFATTYGGRTLGRLIVDVAYIYST